MSLPSIRATSEPAKSDEAFIFGASSFEAKRSLLSVLWRRWRMFLSTTLTLFILLGAGSFRLPKTYIATALLAYDLRPVRTVNSAVSQSTPNELVSERIDPSVLASEVGIITSRATIVGMLEDHPELASPPGRTTQSGPDLMMHFRQWIEPLLPKSAELPNAKEEEFITQISRHLNATVPQASSLIQVSFQANQPAYATAVANGITAAYLKDQVAAKHDTIHGTIQRLQVRLGELGHQVVAADQAVQDFRLQHNLLKPTAGIALPNMQQLTDLSIQEGRINADLALKAGQLEALKEITPAEVVALQSQTGPGSQMTQFLGMAQTALQKRLGEHEGRYLPNSSGVSLLRLQLAKAEVLLVEQGRLIVQNGQREVDALKQQLATVERTKAAVSADIQRENALDSQLLRLTAESQSRKASYDTFLTGFTRMQMLENAQVADVRLVSSASPPVRPVIPEMVILILLVPVSCLLAGILVVISHNRRSGMGLTDREFERTFGLPVFGITPFVPKKRLFHRWAAEHARTLDYSDQTLAGYTQAVRSTRNLIDLHLSETIGPDRSCQSVALVSAVGGEGKSGLAISLAAAWAASGKSTLLIDCDFHRPTLQSLYNGSENDVGLAAFFAGQADLNAIIRPVGEHFDLLPIGGTAGGRFYDFGETQMRDLLSRLGERYDRVILDMPPLMAGADAQIGAAIANLTILVSRWNGTPKRVTEDAVERLRALHLRRCAAVLTKVDMKKYYAELGVSSYVYATQRL